MRTPAPGPHLEPFLLRGSVSSYQIAIPTQAVSCPSFLGAKGLPGPWCSRLGAVGACWSELLGALGHGPLKPRPEWSDSWDVGSAGRAGQVGRGLSQNIQGPCMRLTWSWGGVGRKKPILHRDMKEMSQYRHLFPQGCRLSSHPKDEAGGGVVSRFGSSS